MSLAAAAGPIKVGDFTVNRLGFGAMRITGPDVWGDPPDRAAAQTLLKRAYDFGHNFFDTADSYGPYVSESLIAEALHPYPADLLIATKGGLVRPSPKRWDECGHPEHLRQAVDGSLRRLKLERIDLYQFHAPDPYVSFADSMSTLAELQRAGKIRHLGISNVTVKQLQEALSIAPIVSVQNRYNLEDRTHEEVLLACEQAGIVFIPWYPLGAGKALQSENVKRIAARLRATPSQIAIAWLLARSPVMLPIPGTGSLAHLEENAAAAGIHCSTPISRSSRNAARLFVSHSSRRGRPMAASGKKKRAKPRKNVRVKAKKATSVPAGLKALDAGWRSFIDHAVEDKPLTEAWSDPAGTARPRAATKKGTATKKKTAAKPKKKTPAKTNKKATRK